MNELNSIETQTDLDAIPLSDQTKFRLNEINKKDYFNFEIQERKTIIKTSKYIAAFDYIDKTLIVLSATSGGISITYFTSVIGIPAGIASASFTLIFSLTTKIIKKSLQVTRTKKKKHNKIVMLAKSKLNSIVTLMSQALIDLDISHEEFKTIVNEKEKYQQMKGSIRNTKSRDELTKNSKMIRKHSKIHKLKKNIFFRFACIKWLKLLEKHREKMV